jgi:hypothetical protein
VEAVAADRGIAAAAVAAPVGTGREAGSAWLDGDAAAAAGCADTAAAPAECSYGLFV